MSVIYVVEIAGVLDSPHVKFPITLTTLSTSKKELLVWLSDVKSF